MNKFVLLTFVLAINFLSRSQESGGIRISPFIKNSLNTFQHDVQKSPDGLLLNYPINNLGNINYFALHFGILLEQKNVLNNVDLGLSISSESAFNGYRLLYFIQPNQAIENTDYYVVSTSNGLVTGTNRIDVGLSMRYNFQKKLQHKTRSRKTRSNVVMQFQFSKDKTSIQVEQNYSAELPDGIISYSFKDHFYLRNKLGYALSFRYEIEFLSKKNKNLFNLFVGYRQGLNIVDRRDYSIQHSNGSWLKISSFSKSSAFNIGIGKSIHIHSKK